MVLHGNCFVEEFEMDQKVQGLFQPACSARARLVSLFGP